jgi:hypothetical protein
MYYLKYVLNADQSVGKAAIEGKIVHGTIEAVSKAFKAGGAIDVEEALSLVWDQEVAQAPHVNLRKETSHGISADYLKARESVNIVLTDKRFSPLHSKIVDIEQRFELTFAGKEWQVTDGSGQLVPFTVTGVMDLVREIDHETVEVIDWKTGKREDFWSGAGGVKKEISDLLGDEQLRLYHLAATQLYEYKNVLLTIYFIRDGGPFTIPFALEDLAPTVAHLWQFMNTVQHDTTLRRTRSWKCRRLCSYGRNGFCEAMWGELHSHLLDHGHLTKHFSSLDSFAQSQVVGQPQQVSEAEE